MPTIIDGTAGITFPNSTVQASAGNVLQVVSATYSTQTSTTAASFSDTGITATITPKFSTSKILIIITNNISVFRNATGDAGGRFQVLRGATIVAQQGANATYLNTGNLNPEVDFIMTISALDSPATTSATIYKLQQYSNNSSAIASQWLGWPSSITLMEIAA
jgi:hypothetical protein